MTFAPAPITSVMAVASSSGVALGICALAAGVSVKIGRTRRVQSGQMAGAEEPRLAQSMPATNVPCMQATLFASEHDALCCPGYFADVCSGQALDDPWLPGRQSMRSLPETFRLTEPSGDLV